jgi:DNA-binding transcriptional MerR regulator
MVKFKSEYLLSDVARITGAKRRSVQLWAEAGAIQAYPSTERAGAGIHRVFDETELYIACVLTAFAAHGLPIGKLLKIAGKLRNSGVLAPLNKIFDAAFSGTGRTFAMFDLHENLGFWSTEVPHNSLEETVKLLLGNGNLSTIIIDLNACFSAKEFGFYSPSR